MRSELGLPDNRCILLYAGRLDERKGIETLLFAYYKLLCDMRRTGQELLLVIVGGNRDPKAKDPQFTHFRQLAKSLQLSEYRRSSDSGCIRFVGSQDQENIAKYYSAADMTVVPSYYEPFGMVAIETQACGTPAVASAVGGLRYALENETGGLLAKPYSPESLCEKLTQLVCNPGLRRELASAGYERVMRKFTWESVASQLLVEYNRMQQVRDRAIEMIRPTQRPARIFKPVALPNQPRTRIPGKSFSQNKSGI
jgi:glycosyltransferase involved in cell wall biosynthesis